MLERAVPTVKFADAELQVRVNALTVPAGAKLECIVRATSPCIDEPGVDFLDPNPVGLVTLDGTVTAPSLRQAALGSGFGESVQVAPQASEGSSGDTFRGADPASDASAIAGVPDGVRIERDALASNSDCIQQPRGTALVGDINLAWGGP